MDSESIWRTRESGGDCIPEAVERGAACAASRCVDDRGGIDGMACSLAANVCGRAGIRFEVEYGMDERHAELHRTRSHSPAISPQRTYIFDDLRVLRKFRVAAFA